MTPHTPLYHWEKKGVDLSRPDEELQAAFPGFPGKAAALEVTLRAGQMLYLPAGARGLARG